MIGREVELARLMSRINARRNSVTVLAGETRIGKSTLLRELVSRLNEGNGHFAGYYECSYRETRDPLLPCLNQLARAVVADPGVLTADVLKKLFENRSKEWLDLALSIARAAPYLDRIVGAAEKVLEEVRGARERLQRQTQLEVTRLDAEMFRELIELLGALVPGHQLVLVVDNFSAVPEEYWSALLSFVQASDRPGRVHFVLGWKLDRETEPALKRLEAQVRPYHGATERLEVLTVADATAWLAAAPWFTDLAEDERDEIVLATGLFAEVIKEVTSLVGAPASEDVMYIKDDYVAEKYADLETQIRDDPHQEFLYQLCLAPEWMSVAELSWLTDMTEQVVLDTLRNWTAARLLMEDPPGSRSFDWMHETRRWLARRTCRDQLADRGVGAANRLQRHYLRNAGFASEWVPRAPAYIDFALLVSDASESSEQLQSRLAAYADALRDGTSNLPSPEDDDRLLHFVLSIQQGRLPGRQPVAGPEFVAESPHRRLNLTKGLVNAINAYGTAERWEDVAATVKRLEGLAEALAEDSSVREELARGLFNASFAHGTAQRWADLAAAVKRLEALADAFPEDAPVREAFASALVNASSAYGRAQSWDDLKAAIDRLETLAEAVPEDGAVRERLAIGLFNASSDYGTAERWTDLSGTLERLEALAEAFPGGNAVRHELAKGLVNAGDAYGTAERWTDVAATVKRLEALVMAFPEDSGVRAPLASGLFNASAAYGSAQNWDALAAILGRLEALTKAFPEDAAVREQLAKGLFNASYHYGTAERWTDLTTTLERLEALTKAFPGDDAVRHELAKGLVNAGDAYGTAERWTDVAATVKRLEALVMAFPEDSGVRAPLASGLFNASGDYGAAERWEDLRATLERLEALADAIPEMTAVIENLNALLGSRADPGA